MDRELSIPTRVWTVSAFAGLAVFAFVYFKNAWVSDDAYILYRSVEQLFAGDGPRWNPHERVQVFTSPLWYWFMAAFRIVSSNAFINAIIAGFVASLAAVMVLREVFCDSLVWLTAITLLLASNGFMDYTSSGLENPLGYFLLALYLYYYFQLFEAGMKQDRLQRLIRSQLICFGLLLLFRHDQATLTVVPTAYVCWRHRRRLAPRQWAATLLIALSPMIGWTLFSLFYYGAVFPNPYYAKLYTGIPKPFLRQEGWHYYYANWYYDPVTIAVIALALVLPLAAHSARLGFLALGIVVNQAYIVYVGGDFMMGRFLSYAYLLSVVVVLEGVQLISRGKRWGQPVMVTVLVIALVLAFGRSSTPVKKGFDYEYTIYTVYGIADERGVYFPTSSLWRYVKNDKPYFPDKNWSREGYEFSQRTSRWHVRRNIGYFGYYAGTDKIIVDEFGLADPLLARLPVENIYDWRIGHFKRTVPLGYREAVLYGENALPDPGVRSFYEKVRIVTQDDLFSVERLKTIVSLNIGRYDHYLPEPDKLAPMPKPRPVVRMKPTGQTP